jgi:DNA-binding NarL/FixJ family response regulator
MKIRPVSVVVADDHPVVLRGLVDLLTAEKEFNVVASCTNGAGCVNAIREFAPAIAVIDICMPGLNGLEVLAAATAEELPTRIVLLTAIAHDRDIRAATAGGVHGIVLKEFAPDVLLHCLREVAAGRKWLPPEIVDAALAREKKRGSRLALVDEVLTQREREVMHLVAEALTNKEIARRLNICDGTVKIHLHNVYQKVAVTNRTALATFVNVSLRRQQ